MATFRTFQSQLLSIMEALTKAAVTEICELVDDSYAVLQLEISRSHKENEALRRKLELIESIIARKNRDAAISGGGRSEEDEEGRQSGGSRLEFNLVGPSSAQPKLQGCGRVPVLEETPGKTEDPLTPAAEEPISIQQDVVVIKEDGEEKEEDMAAEDLLLNDDGTEAVPSGADDSEGGPSGVKVPADDLRPWDRDGDGLLGRTAHSGLAEGGESSSMDVGFEVESDGETRHQFLLGSRRSPASLLGTSEQNCGSGLCSSLPYDSEMDSSTSWTNQHSSNLLSVTHRSYLKADHQGPALLALSRSRLDPLDLNRDIVCCSSGVSFAPRGSAEGFWGEFGFCSRGGMSVLSSRALQEQLSVIMGALTKAAVAEICELVDEGYAVLQMEISRSHKENEDLKKKLQLIESIVVRGSGGARAATEGMEPPPSSDKVPQPDASPRQRDGDRGEAAAASGGHGGASGAEREELPEVVLIKDEDSDSNDTEDEDDRVSAERVSARGGATSITAQRRRSRRTEDSDKLSDQMEIMSSAPAAQAKLPVYTLDPAPDGPGCSSQLVEGVPVDGGESACSFSSQMYFSSSALMEAQSPSSRAELDLSVESVWPKQSKGSVGFGPFVPNESGDAFGLKLVSVSGSSPADGQLSDSRGSVFECDAVSFGLFGDQAGPPQLPGGPPGAGVHRKRFVCSICNKTYANTQNLEVHMRIHTGERPFSCSQCGKKFTQSAHLKSHLTVHSGERPFSCKVCTKSFMVKYSLKLHMKKCHSGS
ncbi:hypothetical protein OJAV_G00169040 [Oryzias javanicus]|uniref:C2H2-type domain-containing protein n=1 Tax=Oryzias javanicus TaxID=123683 RepID=A0A3S2PA20_ORYJA|nr:hypothetical protein OJAV_G00169040 [Oryzias javanicus]